METIGRILKKYPSGFFMGLILLACLGAIMVYYFYVAGVTAPPDKQEITVNADLYAEVINRLKNHETIIQEEAYKTYPDIFK